MRRLSLLLALPLVSLTFACSEKDDDEDDDGDDSGSSAVDDGFGSGVGGSSGSGGSGGSDDPYAKSYTGGYNVNTCGENLPEATSPSGPNNDYAEMWAPGDVMPNLTFTDQHGEQVDLYSFCGNHVMIAFGAMWCGPCQSLAAEAQDIQDEYGDEGFQMIEVLIENTGGSAPSQSDLQSWESNYGMSTVPVLDDSAYQLWPYVEADWGIPTIVHIGPGMEVLSVDQGVASPGQWL